MNRSLIYFIEQSAAIAFAALGCWMFLNPARPLDATPVILVAVGWVIGKSWID